LGLRRQEVDRIGESDVDLIHAVKCWLCARGERVINLHRASEPECVLAQGAFTLAELSDTALAQEPARLITLCPSNAEMVHALDCFVRVIACEDSSDYPAEVAKLERLGPDLAPKLERVAELQPDLVLSSLSVPGMERNVTGLRARGIRQIVLAPRSLADVMSEIEELARVLGVPEKGRAVCEQMQREIDALRARQVPDAPPARVYLEWWPKPMFTPGATCYSNELIQLAGGRNVFDDRPASSVEIQAADLLHAAPEVCFVSWCGVALDKLDPANIIEREGLSALPCVKRHAVFPLDERFSGRPGPRMLEAARVMAEGIRRARSVGRD
jgi:ABC-type Fe3+-hydroxamate transport system substrate-binding protein